MVAIGKILRLTQGPSREKLFDALRLGRECKPLSIVEFWSEERNGKSKSGARLRVQVTALTSVDVHGGFVFWGKLKVITSGENYKPPHESKDFCHVYGVWNTARRHGKITFGETSFLTMPFLDVPEN